MKKYRIVIILVLCLVAAILYLQFGRDVKVVSSMNSSSGAYYEMNLTVVANRLFIIDKEKFAEDLIRRCIANTFHKIKFSYDVMGYPDRLKINVYLNKKGNRYLTIYYKPNGVYEPENNIKSIISQYKILIVSE